jgi:hypothetical protein
MTMMPASLLMLILIYPSMVFHLIKQSLTLTAVYFCVLTFTAYIIKLVILLTYIISKIQENGYQIDIITLQETRNVPHG